MFTDHDQVELEVLARAEEVLVPQEMYARSMESMMLLLVREVGPVLLFSGEMESRLTTWPLYKAKLRRSMK